jgi:hypothetical protein
MLDEVSGKGSPTKRQRLRMSDDPTAKEDVVEVKMVVPKVKLEERTLQTWAEGISEKVLCLTGLPLGTVRWVADERPTHYVVHTLNYGCKPGWHDIGPDKSDPVLIEDLRNYVRQTRRVAKKLAFTRPIDLNSDRILTFLGTDPLGRDPFAGREVTRMACNPDAAEDESGEVAVGRMCLHTLLVPKQLRRSSPPEAEAK